jgi:tRNA(Ile)-lysidine synthase
MHKFVRNLITEWRRLGLLLSSETVVVAVSGGADSVSLLLALIDLKTRKKLDLRIVAAHFDHNLRPESGEDEAFVKALAEEHAVEFAAGRMDETREGNLEEFARRERYKFLKSTAVKKKAFAVLTGHTKNDQAETFLINLIRGSGVTGLGAMRPVRELASATLLVRPLLSWATRSDTEAFCRDSGVVYRTDSMNDDKRFTRVRIRKELIPKLEEYNPKIVDTLARTAEMLAELEPQAADESPESLDLRDLKTLERPELYRTLRSWLRSRRGHLRRLEMNHIESIARLISSSKSGKRAELPGGEQVIKQNGRLVFVQTKGMGRAARVEIKVEK